MKRRSIATKTITVSDAVADSSLSSLFSSRCPLVRKRVFQLALGYFWKNYPAGTICESSDTPLKLFSSSCLTSLCHATRCLLAIRALRRLYYPNHFETATAAPCRLCLTPSPTAITGSPTFSQAPIRAWPIPSSANASDFCPSHKFRRPSFRTRALNLRLDSSPLQPGSLPLFKMATKEDQDTIRLLFQYLSRAFYEPKFTIIMDRLARNPV